MRLASARSNASLIGNILHKYNFSWRNPHKQLTFDTIALSIRFRQILSHVSACNTPCPVIQRNAIATQNCSSVNLNVAKWWPLIIHAQANSPIPHDIQRLDGCMPGSKEECVTIQVKPDRSNMRTPIFSHCCQLSSPNLLYKKIS